MARPFIVTDVTTATGAGFGPVQNHGAWPYCGTGFPVKGAQHSLIPDSNSIVAALEGQATRKPGRSWSEAGGSYQMGTTIYGWGPLPLSAAPPAILCVFY